MFLTPLWLVFQRNGVPFYQASSSQLVLFLYLQYYSFFIKMFLTSSLKYLAHICFCFADQLNMGCLNCGLPALCSQPTAHLLVLDSVRSATSVMALTSSMAALVIACIIVCISAIFVYVCYCFINISLYIFICVKSAFLFLTPSNLTCLIEYNTTADVTAYLLLAYVHDTLENQCVTCVYFFICIHAACKQYPNHYTTNILGCPIHLTNWLNICIYYRCSLTAISFLQLIYTILDTVFQSFPWLPWKTLKIM